MDVVVLDDDLTISDYMAPAWAERDVTIFQTDDPEDLSNLFDLTSKPEKWSRMPHATRLSGIVLDIDLGGVDGPLEGILAAARLAEARASPGSRLASVPVVIRTQHLSKERDLAAELMAELLGQPIPWFNRGLDNERLFEYLVRIADDPNANVDDLTIRYVRSLTVVNQNRNYHPETKSLSAALLSGNRWKFWTRSDMFGSSIVNFRGEAKTTWENMNKIPTALVYMLETRQPLHAGEVAFALPGTKEYSDNLDVLVAKDALANFRGGAAARPKEDASQVLAEYRQLLTNPKLSKLLAEALRIEIKA